MQNGEQIGDDGFDIGGGGFGGAGESAGPFEELPETAPGGDEDAVAVRAGPARTGEDNALAKEPIPLLHTPDVNEFLAAGRRHPLLIDRGEIINLNAQFTADIIEQDPGEGEARFRIGTGQERMSLPPAALFPAERGEMFVFDRKQTALLQVGGDHPPAFAKIAIEMITQHVPEDPVAAIAGKYRLRVIQIGFRGQQESFEDLLSQFFVAQPRFPRRVEGAAQGGPEEGDLDKVVEMSGLEGGVLPVVGKAQ